MKNVLIVAAAGVLSLLAAGASLFWALSGGGDAAWASLAVAVCSLFFNVSGAVYLSEGMKLEKNTRELKEYAGQVAVAIPVCNPKPAELEKCVKSARELEYFDDFGVFVLDDTEDSRYAKGVRELCGKLGAGYMHRGSRKGGKGGALNSFLQKTDADFIAILDGDEIVRNRRFLLECMGHFGKKKVAFVQTNKECRGKGFFERAANYTNAAFVNLIQPINSRKGVALFTGSCGIFRVSALRDVGGFPDSIIEDIAVSLRLLWKGWGGEHVSKVYAIGGEVGSFGRFAEQHMRYICGLTNLLPQYFANIWKFPLEKKMILLVHSLGLHYVSLVQVIACAVAVYAALSGSFWGEIASFSYLFASFMTLILLAKAYSGSVGVGAFAYLMNFSVAVPRLLSSAGAVLGLKLTGHLSLAFSAIVQLCVGGGLLWLSYAHGSVALLWWALLFLSNPVFLLWKK
ncbi:glycosyltransferase [Candidatus Micrarchaeota archaeon]|nr:glycosyltransferase [Candidatus Micrarchaeota archaeon]